MPEDEQPYAYTRTLDDERWLMVLDWSARPAAFGPLGVGTDGARVTIADYDDPSVDPSRGELRPHEAVVHRLRQSKRQPPADVATLFARAVEDSV